MRKPWILHLVLLVCFASSTYAQQRADEVQGSRSETRIALVIGNSNYTVGPLKNPANDAQDIARVLADLGFDVINKGRMLNLTRKEMREAVNLFGERLRNGGVGLFYYAGHGMQVNGANFLIPVNANINNEDDVKDESFDVEDVLAKMEKANNGMNIVILDACRNNPFARSYRSSTRGLAEMRTPSGTLIAYATAPGSVASDGSSGRNGLYTQALIEQMRTPGLQIEEVFKRVRISVMNKTDRVQRPWEATSLNATFYFIAGDATPPETQAAPAPIKSTAGERNPMDVLKKWGSGTRSQPVGADYVGVYKNMNDSNSNLRLNPDATFTLRKAQRPSQYQQFAGNYLEPISKPHIFSNR